ncbi:MAG: hypothetical protein H6602_10570 [Flavobacteriales bacterium]|nr:hypothetical protein [Flavobacteriales bacterium]
MKREIGISAVLGPTGEAAAKEGILRLNGSRESQRSKRATAEKEEKSE